MGLEFTFAQFITAVLMGSVALNTYFVKRELSGLRQDIKEEQLGRQSLALKFAELEARCHERHKTS